MLIGASLQLYACLQTGSPLITGLEIKGATFCSHAFPYCVVDAGRKLLMKLSITKLSRGEKLLTVVTPLFTEVYVMLLPPLLEEYRYTMDCPLYIDIFIFFISIHRIYK